VRGDGFLGGNDGLVGRFHFSRPDVHVDEESETTRNPSPPAPRTTETIPLAVSERPEVPSHVAANGSPLPADLKAELRRLLARILVADMRVNPPDCDGDLEPSVASPSGHNRNPGEAA